MDACDDFLLAHLLVHLAELHTCTVVPTRQCSLSKRSGGNQHENKEHGMVKGWVAHPARDTLGVHNGSAARGSCGELPWEGERDGKIKGKQNVGKHFFFPLVLFS